MTAKVDGTDEPREDGELIERDSQLALGDDEDRLRALYEWLFLNDADDKCKRCIHRMVEVRLAKHAAIRGEVISKCRDCEDRAVAALESFVRDPACRDKLMSALESLSNCYETRLKEHAAPEGGR